MDKQARIYIAGHRGLVGSAILRTLQTAGYTQLITRTHQQLDLLDAASVEQFFCEERPEYVFLAAAHVGGIAANNRYRADFLYNNLGIQQNVLGCSHRYGVKKLLFLGSTCIYPREAPQPIREEYLLTSPLEYTNEPYAIAKIAGLKMCESFNLQYGCNFLAVMPTNLYGPGDNFHLENSHVLPAIMRKMHLAKLLYQGDLDGLRRDVARYPIEGLQRTASLVQFEQVLHRYGISRDSLTLWGSGTPLREFMWSEDMAEACLYVMEHVDFTQLAKPSHAHEVRNCHINIGTGVEHTIKDVALLIQRAVGYRGVIQFDPTHPDGTPRKLTDPSKLKALGWSYHVTLEEGIPRLYQHYLTDTQSTQHYA